MTMVDAQRRRGWGFHWAVGSGFAFLMILPLCDFTARGLLRCAIEAPAFGLVMVPLSRRWERKS